MAMLGYARVSSVDQSLTSQEEALQRAGCDVVRSEKVSGTSRQGRSELDTLLKFVRGGDTVVVTKIDRLARSLADLQDIIRILRDKGAFLMALDQAVDTRSAAGKAFIDMLGIFAEFETNLRKDRQMEGIRAAKAKGIYKGRPPSIDPESVRARAREGLGATQIAQELGISKTTVYRLLKGGEGNTAAAA